MNLFSFIDNYGDYTFEQVPFNEIDNVILSMLSYINFKGIVSRTKYNPKRLQLAGELFFEKYDKKQKNILSIMNAIKILKNIKDTKRYGDLLLYSYVYESNGESQFGALTIEINKNKVYVSFEGTDDLIVGWKEDFMLSYMFPVLSQKKAISYVNRNFLFSKKEIILGGHSKGGNLALVAGMYANFFVRDKIIKVYNNDGPGLLCEQFESRNYQNIKSKLINIIPNYSIVGLLFNHEDNMNVVKSLKKNFYSHDSTTWIVKDNCFENAELSSLSKKIDDKLLEWLKKYPKKEREKFVVELFRIFDRCKIDSLVDIMNNKKLIFEFILKSKNLDSNTKKILKELVFLIFDCFKSVSKEELLVIFNKK